MGKGSTGVIPGTPQLAAGELKDLDQSRGSLASCGGDLRYSPAEDNLLVPLSAVGGELSAQAGARLPVWKSLEPSSAVSDYLSVTASLNEEN